MNKVLVIDLAQSAEGRHGWILTDLAGGHVLDSGQAPDVAALAAVTADEDLEQVLALAPGPDVVLRRAGLPARNTAQARAAAPFLLEDDLSVDPSRLHFALGPAAEDGTRWIAAVDREVMAGWQTALRPFDEIGVTLVPEPLAIAVPAHGLTLIEREGRVLASGADIAFAAEAELMPLLLPEVLADIEKIYFYGDRPAAVTPEGGWGARIVTRKDPLSLEAFLRKAAAEPAADRVDLLQGPFALRRRFAKQLGPWRRAGVLAASLLLAFLALQISLGVRYDLLADKAYAQAEARFREAFPETRRVVNPRTQMKARLNELRSAGSDAYLRLNESLFRALARSPSVRLESLRYDGGRQQLTVNLSFDAYDQIEPIKTALGDDGFAVEEGGTRQGGERLVGDLTVRVP